MHLIPHQPHPPAPSQILHNLCFSFVLGLTAVPREIEDTAYAKLWGAKKVEVAYASTIQRDQFHPTANNCCSVKNIKF